MLSRTQILLTAIQDFSDWSNMQLNLGKTVVVVSDGGSRVLDPPRLIFKNKPVKVMTDTESFRHLVSAGGPIFVLLFY